MTQSLMIDEFPWTVIESPERSFSEQNQAEMKVLPLEQGPTGYGGPKRHCVERWRHTAAFYVLEPVEVGIYIATSLNDRFHYQVRKSEKYLICLMEAFCLESKKKFEIIKAGMNYHDENILVVHQPSVDVMDYINSFDDSLLIKALTDKGKLDLARGNTYIDTGFASAQSQTRNIERAGISEPSMLEHTTEPHFVDSMVQISKVMDMLCREKNLGEYHRVDGIQKEWAQRIHPDNLMQQSRVSLSFSTSAFSGHLDSQNDPRYRMSPVPVIHRIVQTTAGPARLAKIGYSRKACYEAGNRRKLLEPIIRKVSKWYQDLPDRRKLVVDDLFHSMEWEESPGHGASGVIFPPHCCKSVGLSPYIDGVIKLQNNYSLSRQHCIAICFNVVTSESPFYCC